MQETFWLKSSPVLTTKAQEIFGEGLVKEAFASTSFYRPDPEWDKKILEERLARHETDESKQIDLEHGDIFIMFSSGNLVKFSSSEWGYIKLAEAPSFVKFL